jgi:hypothetical protein
MEGWTNLDLLPELPAPDVRFYETATAADIDRGLRALGRVRSKWEAILGYCAHAVKQSRIHALLGFASFRHYVEERLGLPPRAVEQRCALEQQIWRSRPLQEARRQGLSYEKLRWLARLPEDEIATCAFHHLRCIHGGFLRVFGRAPDDLTWMLDGHVWLGPALGC